MLYEDKDIYLLDEPTSALDLVNSQKVIETLITNKAEKTIICSIHNLSLVKNFDRVIVLNDGRVIVDDVINKVNYKRISDYFDETN